MDFYKYGGPGIKYDGGRLPPRIKDIIVHYFFLLGLNPNEHAKHIPEDYEDRDLDNLSFIPPPTDFIMPSWATPKVPGDTQSSDDSEDEEDDERPSDISSTSARIPASPPTPPGYPSPTQPASPTTPPASQPRRPSQTASQRWTKFPNLRT